ncbi:MAG: YicC family protein [Firmicutes bacterium]|nr:YicC family protein [Bacillota bacterium]
MTGYGRAECIRADFVAVVEMKAVNHRFTDVSLRFGRELFAAEERVRAMVASACGRGRIDVYATIANAQGQSGRQYVVNQPLLQAALRFACQVTADAPIDMDGPGVGHLLALPGLFVEQTDLRDPQVMVQAVVEAAERALAELLQMKQREGVRLTDHLLRRADDLQEVCDRLKARAPQSVLAYREKLAQRLSELLSQLTPDAQRMAFEVALFAEKTSVEEELERLDSHVMQWRQVIAGGGTVGKQLDFLLQEMARELSTIGAKVGDLDMTQAVLLGKHILEQMREQVQNVE